MQQNFPIRGLILSLPVMKISPDVSNITRARDAVPSFYGLCFFPRYKSADGPVCETDIRK